MYNTISSISLSLFLLSMGCLSCNLEKVETTDAVKFTTSIGGSGMEIPYDVISTSDGGLVVVGLTQSFGNGSQAYIVKLNKDGLVEWEKDFGGQNEDYATAVVQSSDGGFVFCGVTTNASLNADAYFVKVNASGGEVWEKSIGVVDSSEAAFGVVQADGGDFFIGYKVENGADLIRLLRINSNGTKKTDKIVRTGDFGINTMIKTSDGKLVLAGSEYGSGTVSYILKLSSDGAYIWENRYPAIPTNYTPGYGVVELQNKSLVLAGSDLGPNTSDHDFNLAVFSEIGGAVYQEFWGGASADELYDIALSQDGEIVVMGYSWSFSGTAEIYLSKRKATDGSKIWEKNFTPISAAYGCMTACSDGGFATCATTLTANSDIVVVKTDQDGNFE